MSEQNTGSGYGAQEVKVNHSQVASETAMLNSSINAERTRIMREYDIAIRTRLISRDSATNATLKDVAEQNRAKAIETAQILNKLIDFVAAASQYTKDADSNVASTFGSTQANDR